MEQVRHQFFPGAIFSVNEHASVRWGGKLDLLTQRLHRDRIADHHVLLLNLLPEKAVFLL
jgi:hypothetical protein